jgi:hypothetical protein
VRHAQNPPRINLPLLTHDSLNAGFRGSLSPLEGKSYLNKILGGSLSEYGVGNSFDYSGSQIEVPIGLGVCKKLRIARAANLLGLQNHCKFTVSLEG